MTVSTEQIAECLQHALPGIFCGKFEVGEKFHGTINDVYRIRFGLQEYALRIRTREEFFAYEKNIIKDAVAGRLLTSMAAGGQGWETETAFDAIVNDTTACLHGGPVTSPISPQIVFYDHRRQIIPYLWTLQIWSSGSTPRIGETHFYAAAGASLAHLHSLKFDRFKTRLDSEWLEAESWTSTFQEEIRERLAFLGIDFPHRNFELTMSGGKRFCLNHNDLQPLNIIIDDNGAASLIDWDNLQIAPPEFDLVKLKYWTGVVDGFLSQSEMDYRVFLESYLKHSGHAFDPEIFRFCELVWLLRVASFEKRRQNGGEEIPKPFPPVQYYLTAIEQLIERTER